MTLSYRSKDEFIEYAAYDCIGQLLPEDRESIRNTTDLSEVYLGLGTFVRDEYINENEEIQFDYASEDELSKEIIEALIGILTKE